MGEYLLTCLFCCFVNTFVAYLLVLMRVQPDSSPFNVTSNLAAVHFYFCDTQCTRLSLPPFSSPPQLLPRHSPAPSGMLLSFLVLNAISKIVRKLRPRCQR